MVSARRSRMCFVVIGALLLAILIVVGFHLRPTEFHTASRNWAGYLVTGPHNFDSVHGTWIQPSVRCNPNQKSADFTVWVGLGGVEGGSKELAQIGTEENCVTGSTDPVWVEIYPSRLEEVNMWVSSGDRITAAVTAHGDSVELSIHDFTNHASLQTQRTLLSPGFASAEWIVEAPNLCNGPTPCPALPLADFGTLQFLQAGAKAGSHNGGLQDSSWSLNSMAMTRQTPAREHAASPVASPSTTPSADGGFDVQWEK